MTKKILIIQSSLPYSPHPKPETNVTFVSYKQYVYRFVEGNTWDLILINDCWDKLSRMDVLAIKEYAKSVLII